MLEVMGQKTSLAILKTRDLPLAPLVQVQKGYGKCLWKADYAP